MATETKMGIVTKLSSIMGELGSVEKKGFNKAQNYRFVRESDIVAALVPLLAKHHLILHTTVVGHEREALYTTQSGMTMWITTVKVDGTWIDGDTGETLPIATFIGTGADTGDKGVYKAMTGAEKYMLMKSFLISTGDDPEADEKVDKTAAAAGAASGTRVVRGKQEGVQRGGKSSLATTAQVSEIARIARDLKLGPDEIQPIISKIVGSEPTEGQSIRQWISGMTSSQASDIVAALSTPPVDSGDNPTETGADTPDSEDETTLAIV
jgi:hypothetical protein